MLVAEGCISGVHAGGFRFLPQQPSLALAIYKSFSYSKQALGRFPDHEARFYL